MTGEGQGTREALAQALVKGVQPFAGVTPRWATVDREHLEAAAAELRKTCTTCRHWEKWNISECPMDENFPPPADGSGFCHRHKEKA